WPTMPAGEVINRIIKTASDRGTPGRDSTFGFGVINPTGALTAEVPAVVDNPLDTAPPPGIARFGSAPVPGEAQSAPDTSTSGLAPRAEDPDSAGGAPAMAAAQAPEHHGWWAAA